MITTSGPPSQASRSSTDRTSPFIVSPSYDRFFFIFQPLVALALGASLSFTPLATERFLFNNQWRSFVTVLSGTVTMAHLVIVFFRSHANERIFRRHPRRFIWAPLCLFAGMMLSSWVLVSVFVLSVWWDVYHSSLQTFGLGRLYDMRAGNDAHAGRGWDRVLNLYLYMGPILAGVSLMDHAGHFREFEKVGAAFFTHIPAYAKTHQRWMTWAVLGTGVPFLIAYLAHYRRLAARGYRVSTEKAMLLASTGLCSIYTWGFNPFGQAFFIMNFFHGIQYFALIWHTEKKGIARTFGLGRFPWEAVRLPALFLFVSTAAAYGLWAELWGQSSHLAMSILLTVSIMHFWYDGFIWSVRKQDV